MRVGIATDHGGFILKEELLVQLRAAGHDVVDFGAHELNPADDCPDMVIPLAQAVAAGKVTRGIAICGSGVGASVCANKVPGGPCRAGSRPLFGLARGPGRQHERHLYGWPDRRTGRGLGSRSDFSSMRVQWGRTSRRPSRQGRLP
jgi:hypothetical protein